MPLVHSLPNRPNMVQNMGELKRDQWFDQISGRTGNKSGSILVTIEPTQDGQGKWYIYCDQITQSNETFRHDKLYLSDYGIVPATADGKWNDAWYLVPARN